MESGIKQAKQAKRAHGANGKFVEEFDEGRMDMLLKCHGLHVSCRLTWPQVAEVYEASTGESVTPCAIKFRVRRALEKHRRQMDEGKVDILNEVRKVIGPANAIENTENAENAEKRQKRENFAVEKCQKRDFEPKKPLKTSFLRKIWLKMANWWAETHDFDDF